jgi:peptidoglycan/LPS O-acetylase OafA/YrhL
MLVLDRTKNDTSAMIDLLRALAAQMVLVGHSINFFYRPWQPSRLPMMQNVGVLLFFVLSGFLITNLLLVKSKNENYGFISFFIERFSRIYTGLVPALILVALVDGYVIFRTGSAEVSKYHDIKTFFANLAMLQSYRGAGAQYDALQWSAFGTASPLWTLSIEWHIYLFVGAIFFMGARPKSIPFLIPIAVVFGQTPCFFLFGRLQPDGVGQSLFLLWIGGAYIATISSRCRIWGPVAAALTIASFLWYLHLSHFQHEYRPASYPFLALAILGVLHLSQHSNLSCRNQSAKIIGFFADYSFTLYLVHYTVLTALSFLVPTQGIGIFLLAIALSNFVAIAVAIFTEMKHRKVSTFLKQLLRVEDRRLQHRAGEIRSSGLAVRN